MEGHNNLMVTVLQSDIYYLLLYRKMAIIHSTRQKHNFSKQKKLHLTDFFKADSLIARLTLFFAVWH